MTPDERIEALLNRAGQTISDLPKSDGKHLTYNRESRSSAEHEVFAYAKQSGYVDVIDCIAMHQDYILHLTDVIDRMETALENVCGERDYLAKHIKKPAKLTCAACAYNEVPLAHDPCLHCGFGIVEALKFARVPEDWSVDDSD